MTEDKIRIRIRTRTAGSRARAGRDVPDRDGSRRCLTRL